MREQIFKHWNFFRILRLILGLIIIIQSIYTKNYVFGILGLLFTTLAVFNIGCNGSSCSIQQYSTSKQSEEVIYEEVDTTK